MALWSLQNLSLHAGGLQEAMSTPAWRSRRRADAPYLVEPSSMGKKNLCAIVLLLLLLYLSSVPNISSTVATTTTIVLALLVLPLLLLVLVNKERERERE